MNYNLATLHAATGDTLMLPGWQGQFVWNYANNTLEFRNGDYAAIEIKLSDAYACKQMN